jgi:hypothetical protein
LAKAPVRAFIVRHSAFAAARYETFVAPGGAVEVVDEAGATLVDGGELLELLEHDATAASAARINAARDFDVTSPAFRRRPVRRPDRC